MRDVDAWLFFDGPEPEHLRPLLAAFRALRSSTPEEEQQGARRSSEGLHAELAQEGDPSVATAATIAKMVRSWGNRRGDELRATMRSPSFDERPAAPPPVEPPPLPVAAPEPRPPERQPPFVDLKDTALELDVPAEDRERMGRWPFKPRAPGPELAWTMKSPVTDLLKGQTTPIGDTSIKEAMAMLPFEGSTGGAAVLLLPRLTLEEYASLRAQLSVCPERSEKILPQYYVVNEAARRALDARWERDLAASPKARATFDKLLAEYTAWLRMQRG